MSLDFYINKKIERRMKSQSIGSINYGLTDIEKFYDSILKSDSNTESNLKPSALIAVVDSTSRQSMRNTVLPVEMKEALIIFKEKFPDVPISLVLTKYDKRFCKNLKWVEQLCGLKIGGVKISQGENHHKNRSFEHFEHCFLTSSYHDVGIVPLREYLASLSTNLRKTGDSSLESSAVPVKNLFTENKLVIQSNGFIVNHASFLRAHVHACLLRHIEAYNQDMKDLGEWKVKENVIGVRNLSVEKVRFHNFGSSITNSDNILQIDLNIDNKAAYFKFRKIEDMLRKYLMNYLNGWIVVNRLEFNYNEIGFSKFNANK